MRPSSLRMLVSVRICPLTVTSSTLPRLPKASSSGSMSLIMKGSPIEQLTSSDEFSKNGPYSARVPRSKGSATLSPSRSLLRSQAQ